MPNTVIKNAASRVVRKGTRDGSGRVFNPDADRIPQFLVFSLFFAKTGPETPMLTDGTVRDEIYHRDTFDYRKEYANHYTPFTNQLNARGVKQMTMRLVPDDAGPQSAVRLWLDVLVRPTPIYETNPDGSFKLDPDTNEKIPTTEIRMSHTVKPVVGPIGLNDQAGFGLATQRPGNQTFTDTDGTEYQSIQYPIMDLRVPHRGKHGDNVGFSIWSDSERSETPVQTRFITRDNFYPFNIAFFERDDEFTTGQVKPTLQNDQFVTTSLKPKAFDSVQEIEMNISDTLLDKYRSNVSGYPQIWGPFDSLHMYDSVIETLLKQFYEVEKEFADGFSDFDVTKPNQHNIFNIFGGESSQGVPYRTYFFNYEDSDAVRLDRHTTVWATGGSDGTMNDEVYAELHSRVMRRFGDPRDWFYDPAMMPVRVVLDSGLPIAAKRELTNVIKYRKDTFVFAVPMIAGLPAQTMSEESSIGVTLREIFRAVPESTDFGTQTMRAAIVGRSGEFISSNYKERVPVLIEWVDQFAQKMGASDGKWNKSVSIDIGPGHDLRLLKNINVMFTPVDTREQNWDNGLNVVAANGIKTGYVPAKKTIYPDDTSILTSVQNVLAICELQYQGEMTHHQFSGVSSMTDDELMDAVNEDFAARINDKFADEFRAVPNANKTELDKKRGYSYHLEIDGQGPNMNTVQTLIINANRLEENQS